MLTPSLQPIVSEYFTQRRERLAKECAKVCLSQKPLLHPSTILTDDDDTIREEDAKRFQKGLGDAKHAALSSGSICHGLEIIVVQCLAFASNQYQKLPRALMYTFQVS
jgi:hypothetical protein